jgi:hypothetical protein
MARNTGIHCLETSLIFLTEDVVVIVDNVEMNKLPRSWLTFQNTCTTAQALDTDTFESINVEVNNALGMVVSFKVSTKMAPKGRRHMQTKNRET